MMQRVFGHWMCRKCFCQKQVNFNPSGSIHAMVFLWLVLEAGEQLIERFQAVQDQYRRALGKNNTSGEGPVSS